MTPVIPFKFYLVQIFNIHFYLVVKSRMEKGFFKLPDCKFPGFWLSDAWFSEKGSLKNKDKLAILKCAESSKFILRANSLSMFYVILTRRLIINMYVLWSSLQRVPVYPAM